MMGAYVPQPSCKTVKLILVAPMHPTHMESLGDLGATWSLRHCVCMVLLMMTSAMPFSWVQLTDGEATWGFCGDM